MKQYLLSKGGGPHHYQHSMFFTKLTALFSALGESVDSEETASLPGVADMNDACDICTVLGSWNALDKVAVARTLLTNCPCKLCLQGSKDEEYALELAI